VKKRDWLILPTFLQLPLCQCPFDKKLQTQNVRPEKIFHHTFRNKAARKMLLKLTPGMKKS